MRRATSDALATVEHDEEVGVVRPREVHRSTHAATSACPPTPPSASRCPMGGSVPIDPLYPNSRSYGPESALYGQSSALHEHLLRNEGAVGSNPITSTTNPGPQTRLRARIRSTG